MTRSLRCLSNVSVILIASCSIPEGNPPQDEIKDARLDVERCAVHDELLIQSVQRVDWERGQYYPSYWKIRSALFPCAYDDPESQGDLALVTYCPKCRAAKARYLKDDDQPFPQLELFGKDDERLWRQYRQDLDAFIARHRREVDGEYRRGD